MSVSGTGAVTLVLTANVGLGLGVLCVRIVLKAPLLVLDLV